MLKDVENVTVGDNSNDKSNYNFWIVASEHTFLGSTYEYLPTKVTKVTTQNKR